MTDFLVNSEWSVQTTYFYTCFQHQVDVFARDYHVICVDMLGHGKSQVKGGSVTIEKTVDLIAEIIAAEGYAQAHLVGVSLGSLIAQAVAYRFPQRVKSITVTGSYSIFGDNSAISQAQNREIVKAFFLILFWMDGFRRYVVKNTNMVEAEREIFYVLDWQKREPNGQLQIILNAGHCANMDNPAAFNQALNAFLPNTQAGHEPGMVR